MGEREWGPSQRARTLGAAEVAWIALPPFALLAVAAIVLLGPPLGHAVFAPGSEQLWPPGWWETMGHPEPAKQGRYLVAALAPLLLAGTILVGARRGVRLRSRTVGALAFTSDLGFQPGEMNAGVFELTRD
jgi:hypothetical protein